MIETDVAAVPPRTLSSRVFAGDPRTLGTRREVDVAVVRFGIYGFAHTLPMTLPQLTLWPMLDTSQASYEKARSKTEYFLTSVGVATGSPTDGQVRQLLFDLQASLTFCQQQSVLIPDFRGVKTGGRPSSIRPGFPKRIPNYIGTRGTGILVGDDRIFVNSRADFVRLCMQRLGNDQFCGHTGFRQALFYATQALAAPMRYVEIDYYLHFSALEMLSRRYCQDSTSKAPVVLAKFLKDKWRFGVVNDDGSRAHR